MGLFSGIASAVKGAITGFNPVGMLASAAVNAFVGKYQTRQQNKAIDAANATALQRESTQFERLRDSAVRAGFNPLTALRSGMFQQANLFAREADTFRGDLFGGLAKAALSFPQARLDAEMRDLERREREANVLYTGALARNAMERGTGFNPLEVSMQNYRGDMGGFTVMRNTNGQQIEVRNDVLHALRLEQGGLFGIAEHWEAIGGEIMGELSGVGVAVDDSGYVITRPVGSNMTTRPYNLRNNVDDVMSNWRGFWSTEDGSMSGAIGYDTWFNN